MKINFLHQEKKEIQQKLIGELIHIKFKENLWQLKSLQCFALKTTLINLLKNTFELQYQNHDLQETWRFVNENCTVHKLLFLKKLTYLSLYHNYLKKKKICS